MPVRVTVDGVALFQAPRRHSGRVEEVSPEERDRRMAEWAKENVGG
jgi:hypothetical protein